MSDTRQGVSLKDYRGECVHLQGKGGALLTEGDLYKKHTHGGRGPGVARKYACTRIDFCCYADHPHAACSCASQRKASDLALARP